MAEILADLPAGDLASPSRSVAERQGILVRD
jgi:hypothetical protein